MYYSPKTIRAKMSKFGLNSIFSIPGLTLSILLYTSQNLSAIAIPPATIVKQSGNVKVEVKQLSVVVGGDPDAAPTGWGNFQDGNLAFVRFQIRIFRNGKLKVSDNVGPYSYRNGDLPELVEVSNRDRDRELEVRISFRDYTGEAKYRNLSEYYYDWNSSSKKYQRKIESTSN
jgi:hypothetical protein